MKRVLLVDPDPEGLEWLERTLCAQGPDWAVALAGSTAEALEALEGSRYDAVVSGVPTLGLDGVEFLASVQEHHPLVVRIVVAADADRDALLRAFPHAHQILVEPCTARDIRGAIRRGLASRERIACEQLAGIETEFHATIPADLLDGSVARLEQELKRFFAESSALRAETLERLLTHSLATGAAARTIAALEGLGPREVELAHGAGALHEIGLLVLASVRRADLIRAWKAARRFGIPTAEAERRYLGASHAAVGAYLLERWGLPRAVLDAVAFHHDPESLPDGGFGLVTAVHVASHLETGNALGQLARELDCTHLERLGLSARLPVWREACRATGPRGSVRAPVLQLVPALDRPRRGDASHRQPDSSSLP